MTPRNRAQSAPVGVAILLAVTVVSMSALTVAVGSVVEEGASEAEARGAAASMDAALDAERYGPNERTLALHEGRLRTVERSVRVLAGERIAFERSVGGLVFAADDRRVRYVGGATVRGTGTGAAFHAPPSLSVRDGTLFLDVSTLDAPAVAVSGPGTVTLRTNVTHDRRRLTGSDYAVAVETRTPAAWERWFEDVGATTTRRSLDGDDVPSVVARFPDVREAYVFVHDLHLEVGR
jgi:flagellin-like protein